MKSSLKIRYALVVVLVAAFGPGTDQDAQTRRPQRPLPDLTNYVNAMKFSPDGRLVAIARGMRDDYRVDVWNTTTGALQKTIRGFDGPVWSVSFSPDGRTLLTGSSGVHPNKVSTKASASNGRSFAELKWWDPQTGEFKQRVELREEDLMSVAAAYSPDGRVVAAVERRAQTIARFESLTDPVPVLRSQRSTRYDSIMKLLDAHTGETIIKLKEGFSSYEAPVFEQYRGRDPSLIALANTRPPVFSPDGQLVAAWNSSEVRLWNNASGAEVLKLNKFAGVLNAIAFSPDSRLLVAATTGGARKQDRVELQSEIRVWEIATRGARQVIPLHSETVHSVAFALNGQQLLIGGLQRRGDHTYPSMELIDLQAGSVGSIISKEEGVVGAIDMSPGGELMAFQNGSSTVRLVDTNGWRVRYTFDSGSEPNSSGSGALRRFLVTVKSVPAVAFLPDGNTVAGEVEGAGIRMWDARTGEVKKAFAQDAETGSIAEVSENGDVIAEVTGDENVRVWNTATGAHTEIPSGSQSVTAIGLSGDGKVLAVAYPDEIALFQTDDPTHQKMTTPIQSKVACIAVSSDGKLLAGSSTDGDLQFWNTADGKPLKHFLAGSGVSALQFAPQSEAIALGTKDGRVSVWDLRSSTMIFESKKHSAMVSAIAFSGDGKLLATGSDDRTAIVWEVGSGKARHTLKGHDFTVTSLAFSPGDNLLAVGSGNAEVVLWDVATGKLNRVMR